MYTRKSDDKNTGAEARDWMHFKVGENLRGMGYNVWHEYTLANRGRVDVMGNKQNGDGTWDTIYVEIKKLPKNAGFHDIIHGMGQLLYYRSFDPFAKLIIAIPEGCVDVSEHLLVFLESYKIQLWQLSMPEHPVAGPEFFGAKKEQQK